jgi:anti-anti-sigma factor
VHQQYTVALAHNGTTAEVVISGAADFAAMAAVDATLRAALSYAVDELVIDLHGVTFIDSRGLASLARAHLSGEQRGTSVRVSRVNDLIRRTVELGGLEFMLDVAS